MRGLTINIYAKQSAETEIIPRLILNRPNDINHFVKNSFEEHHRPRVYCG